MDPTTGRTEDRVDIDELEPDLPPRSLPGMRPARSPEQAKGERALYRDLARAWRRTTRYLWQRFGLPGKALAAQAPFLLTPDMERALDQAADWYADTVMGRARDVAAYSDPSNAYVDLHLPTYNGEPILPGHLRTAWETGLRRATALTGADAPQLLGVRNQQALEQMMQRGFERLSTGAHRTIGDVLTKSDPEVPAGQGQSVRDLLIQGMENGDNPLKVARDLRGKFADIETYNWSRLSRTEIGFAQQHAMMAEYAAEGFTDLPGVEYPIYHPNCCLEGTQILAEGVLGGIAGWYRGPVVELTLADGSQLTVTVNHVVLTPRGFVKAGQLRKGDNVLYATGFDGVGKRNPDVNRGVASIEQVFGAILETQGSTSRYMPVAAEDVHGDGAGIEGHVHVVTSEGLLGRHGPTGLLQQAREEFFRPGGADALPFARGGDLTAVLIRLALTADGIVSRPDHPFAGLGGHAISGELLGFLVGAEGNTGVTQQPGHPRTAGTEPLGEALDAVAGQVECREVVNVRERSFAGHVYDLQTFSSLYIANGVLSSNCVCSTTLDLATGYMIPDVAVTACFICQAANGNAQAVLAAEQERLLGARPV